MAPPSGWTNIGDAEGDVLANGTYHARPGVSGLHELQSAAEHVVCAVQRDRAQLDHLVGSGQERPLRRGGVDARARWSAADRRHLADPVNRIVHPQQPRVVLRGQHAAVAGQHPVGRDRSTGRDARRQHVRGRRRYRAREPGGVHHVGPGVHRAVQRRKGKWVNSPAIPPIGGQAVRQRRRPGVDAARRQRPVRRQPVRLQRPDRVRPV